MEVKILFPKESTQSERLDKFLSRQMIKGESFTRSSLTKIIDGGGIKVNGNTMTKAGYKLKKGDEIIV